MAKRKVRPIRKASPEQRDMFPARKKLAEQARVGQLGKARVTKSAYKVVAPSLPTIDAVYEELKRNSQLRADFEYLRELGKVDGKRIDNMTQRMTDVEERLKKLAHAVELLAAHVQKSSVHTPKQWSQADLIRLNGEIKLMVRTDGEIDWNVLSEIHDCTLSEVREAASQLKGKEYA